MNSKLACLSFVLTFQMANAQWKGVLTYTDNYDIGSVAGKTITIISESDNKGRIESKTYPTKSPDNNLDEKDQNVLLYNFSTLQKTILVQKTKMAVSQAFAVDEQRNQLLMQREDVSISIEDLGLEKVGPFNCTHYVMTTNSSKMKTSANTPKKNIWITSDLGNSNIWYVGPYLYYISGGIQQKKLAETGASGVVVKWQYGDAEATLTGHQPESLPLSTFEIPSDYTTQ
jgi:hypothetical protein